MPSSRVYAFGQPENDGERQVIRHLDQNLHDDYWIYHSLERQHGGQTYDWDVIVLAPHAIFCLEVKNWLGRIIGNDREWLLNNGAVRGNPYPLIAKKARMLKSRLVEHDSFLKAVWVEPLVVIADEKTQLALSGDCALHTVTLAEVVARLTDTTNPQWERRDHRRIMTDIERVLTEDFRPAVSAREVAQFRLLEQLDATDLYTEWRAENRFVPNSPTVRLKVYAPDPYLPTAQRDEQLRLIRRDFEAASHMGNHPHILAARDFFPDEDGRYILVLDDILGEPLAANLLANLSLTFEYKLSIVQDIADGLAHAHACKVIHRDIRPGNILLAPTGAVLINFDCARIGNGSTVHSLIESGLDPNYIAPEVRASAAAATVASDVYALGVILYELLTGRLPEAVDNITPPSSFDRLIDRELDRLVLEMIAIEPVARPSADAVRDALANFRDQRRAPTQAPVAPTPSSNSSVIDFAIDEKIEGQYLVREVLGEGSYGKVYRVYSAVTDREYAMKVFRDSGLGLEDAQKEFIVLEKLSHSRIARVWHAGQLRQGAYYLLTDCIAGRPLQHILDTARLAPMHAIRITLDLLGALSYLHSKNYVHRDIKPSNIIVSPSGAWLIDFSIAAPTTASSADRAGTPLYTPPDVATCGGEPTRDLFAVGVVLYELLTGRHPYDGPPSPGSAPRDPLGDQPQLTDALAELLRHAVAPTAVDRYVTADAFLAALRAIEEPFRPLPATYPLAQGITITDEEKNRANYNPYLTRFLTLYSQNEIDNSGTRGYDEVSRATYVRTRLDKRLGPDILAGRFRLVIITGNAGDGKTAFLQRLEEDAENTYKASVVRLPSGNGATFVIGNRNYHTNYDGSQNEGSVQNDDVLTDFFSPFKNPPDEDASSSFQTTRLIAINEGKLRDFLTRHQADFPWLSAALLAHVEQGHPLPEGYLLVNLNHRSVTMGERSILDEQIQVLCDPAFWEPCRYCQYANRCPVKFNVDTFNHPDLGPRARLRLEQLFTIAHLRGRMHLTMRGIRSAMAYILFGDKDCTAIAATLDTIDTAADWDEELLKRFYYNAIKASEEPSVAENDAASRETDRLLSLISEADVGPGSNPADDRDLYFEGPDSPLLPKVTGRTDYDSDLMQAMTERLRSSAENNETQGALKRLHTILRRKAFFERPDDGWEAMLPYSMLRSILGAVDGNEEELAALKTIIIRGINHGEGLSDMDHVLVLRLARGVPGHVQSFRQFPAADFILRQGRQEVSREYLEYSPAYLELVYRPNTNGSAVGRPTLRLDLDLIELLSRMARGYAPTPTEWRGALVNLLVFRTLLAHEPYNRLILIDTDQERRFMIEQQGGKIELALEGRPNGAH